MDICREESPLYQLSEGNPEILDAQMVMDAFRLNDPLAGGILQRAASFLAAGIAQAVCILDPQIVIVGGGVMHSGDMLLPGLRTETYEQLPAIFNGRFELKPAALDGYETLVGAALLTQGY